MHGERPGAHARQYAHRRAVRRLAFALAFALASAARADFPVEMLDRPPGQIVRETFDSEYGRLIVAEFGRLLRLRADPQCLRSSGIDPGELDVLGGDLLLRNGTRNLEIHAGMIDAAKFDAALSARAGKNAKAELARLKQDPDVKKLIELGEPERLARLAEHITEILERVALLAGIKFPKPISPIAGNSALLDASPVEKSMMAQERFIESRNTPQVERWVQLQEAAFEAYEKAFDRERYIPMPPRDEMPEALADLARLCVFPEPRKPK